MAKILFLKSIKRDQSPVVACFLYRTLTWYLMPLLKYPAKVLDSDSCISLNCTGVPPRKSSSCVAKMAAAPLSS